MRAAYAVARSFGADADRRFVPERHSLVCASRGVLRLQGAGSRWLLPPARAALVAAGQPVVVGVPKPVMTASIFIDSHRYPPPTSPLAVFDLTPLAQALVREAATWAAPQEPMTGHDQTVADALVAVVWRLAANPNGVVMPVGRSLEVIEALSHTEDRPAGPLTFDEVAAHVGLAPRSLARRFQDELGLTWRGALRRSRIQRAVELLAVGEASVARVAHDVGYGSLSAFSVAFRDLTGHAPSKYRDTFGS
ncbi:MAG: helix-turn-helix domain-containing protein [Phycicoccus sp.]|nr:helix-turn-helix domain-containing protein [Phycicoccus sp.]